MASEHQVGDVIDDRYELLFPMRSGGMGVVWRARDLLEEGEVTVKEIRFPAVIDEAARQSLGEKLVEEARLLQSLEHPGLVRVTDVLDGRLPPLVVTELVEGPSLADVVAADGPLSPDRVAVVGAAALESLAAVAASGLAHRFLRPSRILLPYDGPVRVADFGVAALVGDPDVADNGEVSDSAGFLPPEHGTDAASAEAADMWALGVTLYGAVEGVPPFGGETAKDIRAAIAGVEPRPPERAGSIGPVLEALLAKDPAHRPGIARVRELLGEVTMESVGARAAPLGPAEALDRMFGRDPDTPQLHLVPPDLDEEPTRPGDVEADVSGSEEDSARLDVGDDAPPPAPDPAARPRSDMRRRFWLVVCAISIVGILGTLAFGGQQAVVGGDATNQPEQWDTFAHESGNYSIDHPPEWEIVQDGNLTDFRDGDTGTALRVGFQEPPQAQPLDLWLQLEEEFRAEHDSYQRVRLQQSVYDGYPAAVWEFTWTDQGVPLHNLDLAVDAGTVAYALNFQTPEADWAQLRELFDHFTASFEPSP